MIDTLLSCTAQTMGLWVDTYETLTPSQGRSAFSVATACPELVRRGDGAMCDGTDSVFNYCILRLCAVSAPGRHMKGNYTHLGLLPPLLAVRTCWADSRRHHYDMAICIALTCTPKNRSC
jgi:hypothetical protein